MLVSNKNVVNLFGYLRIFAYAILVLVSLFAAIKCSAIAPHAPEISLQVKIDYERQAAERARQRKAQDKVDRHQRDKKAPKPSKREQKDASKERVRTLNQKSR